MSFISVSVMCILFQFPSSFLTIVLENEFGIESKYHGFVLALPAVTYITSSTLCGFLIHFMPKRIFIQFSFLLIIVALILFGPSNVIGIP